MKKSCHSRKSGNPVDRRVLGFLLPQEWLKRIMSEIQIFFGRSYSKGVYYGS
jgi:hypothetical protein